MNAKLTLTIEKSIIEKAKLYAKKSGRSLSNMIESYLERLVVSSENSENEVPNEFNGLFGCVSLPTEMDDKASIRSILIEKYNR